MSGQFAAIINPLDTEKIELLTNVAGGEGHLSRTQWLQYDPTSKTHLENLHLEKHISLTTSYILF